MDSYKLVPFRSTLFSLLVGSAAAAICYLINISLLRVSGIDTADYSRYIAPVVEESLKAIYIAHLIHARKTGFLVDAAIYGFAVGAGFAIVENSYYVQTAASINPLTFILRGFGTAIMHGGLTSIFAILMKTLYDRLDSKTARTVLPALLPVIIIHSLFNHFYISPAYSALIIILILPVIMLAVFKQSERSLAEWLGIGFDSDAELLEMITTGEIMDTHIGEYLISLKEKFPGEMVADILCLLRIHLELSIRAKGILLMKSAGFSPEPDPEIAERFEELKYLQKSIGSTGMLALHPLLRWSSRDLWQLNMLEKE